MADQDLREKIVRCLDLYRTRLTQAEDDGAVEVEGAYREVVTDLEEALGTPGIDAPKPKKACTMDCLKRWPTMGHHPECPTRQCDQHGLTVCDECANKREALQQKVEHCYGTYCHVINMGSTACHCFCAKCADAKNMDH